MDRAEKFFPVLSKSEQSSSLQLCKLPFHYYPGFGSSGTMYCLIFKNEKLQVPWQVITNTTKPYQHFIIIPEGTQQACLLEKHSFAPAARLGKPTPDCLQRPSWTGGFCSIPGISPDLGYFTASGCREQLQSLGTAARNILPALPCLFLQGAPAGVPWMAADVAAWQGLAAEAQAGPQPISPEDPQTLVPSVLSRKQVTALCISLQTWCCVSIVQF